MRDLSETLQLAILSVRAMVPRRNRKGDAYESGWISRTRWYGD
jgi:hypothetical protein